ncbi:hypothetical protein EJ419_06300 [Alloscardovia theropitheci]|uniref:Uncharacterized protein n=1 Tax=Alloscardovia theropitheci TaxID=2496842 RepID=A0A4R0QWG7_9BIFI|nr:hypothetical protein [Alloscardovia theropitheci]TCD53860.1 hypothetical protein EJ419_06300 [Alloscardovia theropitheci]
MSDTLALDALRIQFDMEKLNTNQNHIPDMLYTWFGDITRQWVNAINENQKIEFTTDERDTFIIGTNKYLGFRDTIILTAINTMTVKKATNFLIQPFGNTAEKTITTAFKSIFDDPTYMPQVTRVTNVIANLDTIFADHTTDEYAPAYHAIKGYLSWYLGDNTTAKSEISYALDIDNMYSLARITYTALSYNIKPAYLR